MEPKCVSEHYQARVKASIVRLYRGATDMMPEGGFVERGEMLITDSAINLYDGTKRLRIVSPEKYVGLWIDTNACDLMPMSIQHQIEEEKTDDLISISVVSDFPIVYRERDSQSPIKSNLKSGDVVKCDEKVLSMSNGVDEIRYHIVSSPDESLINYWILMSAKVKDPTTNRVIEIAQKVKVDKPIIVRNDPPSAKPMIMRMKARTVSTGQGAGRDDILPGGFGGGGTSSGTGRRNIVIDANEKDPVTGDYVWQNQGTTKSFDELMNATSNPGHQSSIILNQLNESKDTLPPDTAEKIASQVSSKDVSTKAGTYEMNEENITNVNNSDPTRQDTSSSNESIDPEIDSDVALGMQDEIMNESNENRIFSSEEEEAEYKKKGWLKFSNVEEEDTAYDYYSYSSTYDGTTLGGVEITRLNYVHGMPFQYTGLTDRRIGAELATGEDESGDQYGRTFAEEIVSNMPIVVFVPGEAKFLSAVSEGLLQKFDFLDRNRGDVKSTLRALMGTAGTDSDATALEQLMTGGDEEYDYFTMEVKTGEYYEYVNSMARLCARNMGLQGRKMIRSGKRCDLIDWGDYNADVDNSSDVYEILGLDGGVSFAYDAQSSVSDSISTSTGDSQLADLLNQSSSAVREINFVMGTMSGNAFINSSAEEFAADDGSGFFSRFKSFFNNTISGLNVRFPEIWQDSSSSKDYSLDMRFIAPYPTKFCIWRYVLVPFIHVLALAAPRSTQRVNSYTSPFLIRAFSKGYFNVEMGMITGMTWKRFGDGDMISADGIPMQIDVTLDFKDLYHTFSISKWKTTNLGLFFNNTGLIDLLGTLSGVNMNRISIADRFSLYGFAFGTSTLDIGKNFMRHVSDRVRNATDKFLMRH